MDVHVMEELRIVSAESLRYIMKTYKEPHLPNSDQAWVSHGTYYAHLALRTLLVQMPVAAIQDACVERAKLSFNYHRVALAFLAPPGTWKEIDGESLIGYVEPSDLWQSLLLVFPGCELDFFFREASVILHISWKQDDQC
jgi:hypothetical protein